MPSYLILFVTAAIAATGAEPTDGPRPTLDEWEATKDEASAKQADAAAKHSKMAAVDKVVSLLQSLRSKVMQEGEDEAHTYDKLACFCKDTTKDKQASIKKGSEEKAGLEAQIAELSSDRDGLDAHIEELVGLIKDAEAAVKEATATRAEEKAEYTKNDADLTA